MSFDSISYYNHDKPLLVEGKRVKKEYENFQKDILDVLDDVLPVGCKRFWFEGNHEYRTKRISENDPQWQGLIEPENNLDLSKYVIVPFNQVLTLGHMNFLHGIYYNKYNAAKHLFEFEDNVFYGHTHSCQIFTKTTPIHNHPKQGVNIGCMCNKNPHYKRNKPNDWVHQFMYFYLLEDGTFHYYLPTIIDNHCVINGRLYVA